MSSFNLFCRDCYSNTYAGKLLDMRKLGIISFIFCILYVQAHAATVTFPAPVAVPSDPNAIYTIISAKKEGNGRAKIVTRREGASGVSFSERLVDCKNSMFKYTAEGDSLNAMKKKQEEMGPLVQGSISYYISAYACAITNQPM
jgi:hypothetical protein